MAKRINVNKLFDELVAGPGEVDGETKAVQTLRNLFRVANDTDHKDYGPQSRYAIDHMMGRPTQKIELTTPQGIQVDASAGVLAMMGVKAITGTFVNAEGEAEELRLEATTEEVDDESQQFEVERDHLGLND